MSAANDENRKHPMPFTRVELCLLRVGEQGLQVLLGRRAGPVEAGAWALPGGVLRIDLDADLDAAAQRVAKERLGIALPYLRQQAAFGGATRDARGWALSIVYRALAPFDMALHAGKRIEELRWFSADDAAADASLAFDHEALIAGAVADLRFEVEALNLPFEAFPEQFTLTEVQTFCELVLARRLDKSSFRRRLAERGCVAPLAGQFRTGANRPAQLYVPA
jgi:8-oxo-dGTP diphosphatase